MLPLFIRTPQTGAQWGFLQARKDLNMYDYSSSTALVTGASSGIGEAIARKLAARGIDELVLVARSADRLQALADELKEAHGTAAFVVPADLADADTPAQIKAETDRLDLQIDLLVNNAGFGSHGYFDERPADRERDMVAVNVAAVVALTRLYLPGMARRRRGGVINIASTAAFQPVPFMATYGATKAFVLSFSEALWAENRDRGVRVVGVCPGGTDTNFDFGSSRGRGSFENVPQSTADEVAEASLRALERNASFTVIGHANYARAVAARIVPRSVMARAAAEMFRPGGEAIGKSAAPIIGAALGAVAGGFLLAYAARRRGD